MASKYRLKLEGREYEVEVEEDAVGYRVRINPPPGSKKRPSRWRPVSLERVGESARYSLILDQKPYDLFAEENPQGYHVVIGARTIAVQNVDRKRRSVRGPAAVEPEAGEEGEWVLTSPMAGVVVQVMVTVDQEVQAGDVLLVVEAMKMQNELRARRGGQVKAIYVTEGQRVDQGTPLLVVV